MVSHQAHSFQDIFCGDIFCTARKATWALSTMVIADGKQYTVDLCGQEYLNGCSNRKSVGSDNMAAGSAPSHTHSVSLVETETSSQSVTSLCKSKISVIMLLLTLFSPCSYSQGVTTASPGPCDFNPCQNNATCAPSGNGGYVCTCAPGWTGQQCTEGKSII